MPYRSYSLVLFKTLLWHRDVISMTIRLPFVRHRRALSDVRVPYDSQMLRFRPDPRPLPAAILNPALSDRSHPATQPSTDRPRLSPLPVSPSLPDLSDVSATPTLRLRPLRLLLPRLDPDETRRCVDAHGPRRGAVLHHRRKELLRKRQRCERLRDSAFKTSVLIFSF